MTSARRSPAPAYRDPLPAEVRVAVVGSGFSGLGIAIGLLEDGERDFVVLERADDIGGTWRDNTYPGCACDVPSHMYSYSFAPNPNWSRSFASQAEIWDYQQDVVARFGVAPYVRTGAGVLDAAWEDEAQRWRIETARGTVRARFLVAGTGPLCEPKYPELPGLERFEGTAFHSARWDHDHDLTGERVAVIGTGASAIQFVPRIQPQVERLTLFQRTPPWIMPRPDRPIGPRERFLLRTVPGLRQLRRLGIYATLESRVLMFNHVPALRPLARRMALRHVQAQVPDPELRAKVTPDYDLGCKRVLLSNDYLPALGAANAEVVTSGVREVRAHSIVDADGVEHPVDTIIYGTGFRVTDQPIAEIARGRDGVRLADRWAADGIGAYRGTTVAGFPNLFLMVGPNTGLGHNSIIYMIESQMAYVRDALRQARAQAIGALAPKAALQAAEQEELQRRLEGTVWNAGGCRSWYLDAEGRNSTLWPDFTFLYRRRTARFALADYELERERPAPVAPVAAPAAEPVAV
ncbi:flavin-containing monooxygenase [Patulibacter defluvii]|uniref:flavin-containing monooxygenase n=1 Tax=Patulibacter defluvii TaxID=3095358 RepID=UPI002A74760C|nr:NAD(P)/FAD-dependent oxidoreductase [Patulibacter sp. DM4]